MIKRVVFLALLILFTLGAVYAQRGTSGDNTIRFASPLPRNSEFGRYLDRMAAEWMRVTNNAINVTVSHDGREGSELDMIAALSSNSIQVALLSSSGIKEICPPIITVSIPFLIRNDRELDAVLPEVTPILTSSVRNDFVIISWAKGGWMYIYSKNPILVPSDLRRQKLASSVELRELNYAFRTMGFNVVESDMFNLGTALANDTVNVIYYTPTAVAPLQLHRYLGNVMDMSIGPTMGAIVMNRVTWNKLTRDQQQAIVRVTQRIADEFNATIPRSEATATSSMVRGGLKLNKPTPAQEAMWNEELANSINSLLGTVFDRDIYNRINNILDRERSGR